MASTPKNPFNGGGSKQGAPNLTIKPSEPAYDGGQFARDSMTPEEISVSFDQYNDEIPSDRTYHTDCTPGHTNKLYVGRQYSDDWMGGYSKYGVTVDSMGASKTTMDYQPDNVKRGKES